MTSCGINLKKLLESFRAFLFQLITSFIFVDLGLDDKNQAGQFGLI